MMSYPTLPPDGIEGKMVGRILNRKWKERVDNHKIIAQRFLIGKPESKSKLNTQYREYIANAVANLIRSNIVIKSLLFVAKKLFDTKRNLIY